MVDYTSIALAIGLGTLVGIVMGFTGAGGGILAVPILVFGLQLTVAEASPIGLLAVGVAAAAGAVIGLINKTVRYRAAALIAIFGVVFTPAGLWLAQRLETRFLSLTFAVVLIWVAYKNFKESRGAYEPRSVNSDPPCIRRVESGRFRWTTKCGASLGIAGSIAGLLSGLLGVGGGFVVVPALQRFTDLSMKSVVATSLSVIALISLIGVATSITRGHFIYDVGIPFAMGAMLGMLIGNATSSRVPSHHLKVGFSAICLIVACGMIFSAL